MLQTLKLDHLVFAAVTLSEGKAWMAEHLGVEAGGGGAHPGMGTHNALWRLGDAYLEVIAIDPDAEAARPRWYGLDDPAVQASIAHQPRLLTWVVAATDLSAIRRTSMIDPGPVVTQSRGDLTWQITVPEDGALNLGGAFPSFIRWPDGTDPPPRRLPDQSLYLTQFSCLNITSELQDALQHLRAERLIQLAPGSDRPQLVAEITTPRGLVQLC